MDWTEAEYLHPCGAKSLEGRSTSMHKYGTRETYRNCAEQSATWTLDFAIEPKGKSSLGVLEELASM